MSHRTMQGRIIDMERLIQQNELMPAIGNMRVNARGDELGANGKIIRKREDVVAEYYNQKNVAVTKPEADEFDSTEDAEFLAQRQNKNKK